MNDPPPTPPAPAPSDGPCDLFLSFNSRDREAVLAVRDRLRACGLSTFLDQESLAPGLPWLDALQRAIAVEARAVAVFLGGSGLGRWQKNEMRLALDRQAREEGAGRSFPVVPVLLP